MEKLKKNKGIDFFYKPKLSGQYLLLLMEHRTIKTDIIRKLYIL